MDITAQASLLDDNLTFFFPHDQWPRVFSCGVQRRVLPVAVIFAAHLVLVEFLGNLRITVYERPSNLMTTSPALTGPCIGGMRANMHHLQF